MFLQKNYGNKFKMQHISFITHRKNIRLLLIDDQTKKRIRKLKILFEIVSSTLPINQKLIHKRNKIKMKKKKLKKLRFFKSKNIKNRLRAKIDLD